MAPFYPGPSGIIVSNNGTALSGITELNFTNGNLTQSGNTANFAAPTSSLTVTDGTQILNNISEIITASPLVLSTSSKTPYIVQSVAQDNTNNIALVNNTVIGNYIILITSGNTITTPAGFTLLYTTGAFPYVLCFFGMPVTSTTPPSGISGNVPKYIAEVGQYSNYTLINGQLSPIGTQYSASIANVTAQSYIIYCPLPTTTNWNGNISSIIPASSALLANLNTISAVTVGTGMVGISNAADGTENIGFVSSDNSPGPNYYGIIFNGIPSTSATIS